MALSEGIPMTTSRPRVFVGCTRESISIAHAIQENLNHDALCVPWDQGIFGLSSTTIESLLSELDKADYAVFVFAPDDIVKIREKTYVMARDNVLFEFGLFTGRLGRNRTFLVMPRDAVEFRVPTDLLGVTPATYNSQDLSGGVEAALGAACNQLRRAFGAVAPSPQRVASMASSAFLHSRSELPPFGTSQPVRDAKDIWLIGQNLNMVFRNKRFFEEKLQSGARIRCLIADYTDKQLISTMSQGVVESNNTAPDFVAVLKTLSDLRISLADQSLLELKTMNYVPTLSFQILDGELPSGTILVEITPNRTPATQRPHFVLMASDVSNRVWYDLFLSNCRQMFQDGQDWDWSSSR